MSNPYLVQYQGSKRLLADQIIPYLPASQTTLVEPFCGTAAVSIAAAATGLAERFILNDYNEPLVALLHEAIERPEQLVHGYSLLWNEQFAEDHVQHYFKVREAFNGGDTQPAVMLYLLARCVKGAVRYGSEGNFNQSPDKRRHGTKPETVEKNVQAISHLLKGRCEFSSVDYQDVLADASDDMVVYMDPPYQGVVSTRDHRYLGGIDFDDFVKAVERLDAEHVPYLISYDGTCGDRSYGTELPAHLDCIRIMLDAGRSSQSTLLGREDRTMEALYVSTSLLYNASENAEQLGFWE